MTLADDLISVARNARGIAGSLGFRVHTVAVLVQYFAGQHVGEEHQGDALTPVTEANGQPPRVRSLTTEEIALGNFPAGSLSIGPITPAFPGGGTPDALLAGKLPENATRYVVLTGPMFPDGAKLTIERVTADKPLRRMLVVANPKPL